jgi:23S rRNA (uridine2552-2'-O)-methyltransferase
MKRPTGSRPGKGKGKGTGSGPGASPGQGPAARPGTGPSGGVRAGAVKLRRARKLTPASQRWLTRQLNDPYVQAAQREGWRSRAAYKLIELDERFKLLKPDQRVLDLGAAPGGWTQVAVKQGARIVVGIDLLEIEPIPGSVLIQGDFLDDSMPDRLRELLGGDADLVLSDMAPNTTGHANTDHIRIMALAETALDFALGVLAPGGAFVAKVFQGGSERGMLELLKRHFTQVRHAKPPASRKDSSELYVVAQGYRASRD